jgi:hypothetical protein
MGDIENVAMAEPALARRRPMFWGLEEKGGDFLERYKTANHGIGEEDDFVALKAEPQEHTRWILIGLVTIGATFIYLIAIYMPFERQETNLCYIMLWMFAAFCPALFAGFLIAECQRDGIQDEERTRLVDHLLQL